MKTKQINRMIKTGSPLRRRTCESLTDSGFKKRKIHHVEHGENQETILSVELGC